MNINEERKERNLSIKNDLIKKIIRKRSPRRTNFTELK